MSSSAWRASPDPGWQQDPQDQPPERPVESTTRLPEVTEQTAAYPVGAVPTDPTPPARTYADDPYAAAADGPVQADAHGAPGPAAPPAPPGPPPPAYSHRGPDSGASRAAPGPSGSAATRLKPTSSMGRLRTRAGRNLPAAIGVGAGLGALILAAVLVYKPLFVALVAVAVAVSVWELAQALTEHDIVLPIVPVVAGGVAMEIAAYLGGGEALAVALALTALAVMVWRMLGGPQNYLRDMTAGVFAALYQPFLAGFAVLLLIPADGAARVLLFFILTICSDTGGFVAGVLYGKHPMAPGISPKKSWEGLAGSVLAASLAGALGVVFMLNGAWWQGVLVGLGAVLSATLGDLVESMIKRDLRIKDMGRLLPGHGGLMDRMDSLLTTAPMVWLLLTLLVAVR